MQESSINGLASSYASTVVQLPERGRVREMYEVGLGYLPDETQFLNDPRHWRELYRLPLEVGADPSGALDGSFVTGWFPICAVVV